MRAVEYRCRDVNAECLCRHSEVRLQHLTDVHTGRHAERIQHDLDRCAVLQERHIFFRQDARDDTLVPVTSSHLVAFGNLALLRDVDAHQLIDTCRQFISIFTGEHLDVDDNAGAAMRHTQRRVAHLARLLAKDRVQQTLFRRQFRYALRRHLADQDVARA